MMMMRPLEEKTERLTLTPNFVIEMKFRSDMDHNRPHPSIYIGYLFRSLYSFWNPLNA